MLFAIPYWACKFCYFNSQYCNIYNFADAHIGFVNFVIFALDIVKLIILPFWASTCCKFPVCNFRHVISPIVIDKLVIATLAIMNKSFCNINEGVIL